MAPGKKKSHEEYVADVKRINPRVSVVGIYVGSETHIAHRCKACEHVWDARPSKILDIVRPRGCPVCKPTRISKKLQFTEAQVISRIELLHQHKVRLTGEYTGIFNRTEFTCNIGHKWIGLPSNVINSSDPTGCPRCNRVYQYSLAAINWLEMEAHARKIYITHAGNYGECQLPDLKFWVDGFSQSTNTVFEFYGDAYHGNPNLYDIKARCHPYNKSVTAGTLFVQTKFREVLMRKAGYNVVSIWEHDFKLLRRQQRRV